MWCLSLPSPEITQADQARHVGRGKANYFRGKGMPEGPKPEAQGSKCGNGVLGDREGAASQPPSTIGDLGKLYKLPQRGQG